MFHYTIPTRFDIGFTRGQRSALNLPSMQPRTHLNHAQSTRHYTTVVSL